MDSNKKENLVKYKPDNICRAGAIVSIISAGIIMVLALIGLVFIGIFLASSPLTEETTIDIIFLVFTFLTQIPTIILSVNVLKGKVNSNLAAGIVSLIFSGLIGGILILVGKYQISEENTENTNN